MCIESEYVYINLIRKDSIFYFHVKTWKFMSVKNVTLTSVFVTVNFQKGR